MSLSTSLGTLLSLYAKRFADQRFWDVVMQTRIGQALQNAPEYQKYIFEALAYLGTVFLSENAKETSFFSSFGLKFAEDVGPELARRALNQGPKVRERLHQMHQKESEPLRKRLFWTLTELSDEELGAILGTLFAPGNEAMREFIASGKAQITLEQLRDLSHKPEELQKQLAQLVQEASQWRLFSKETEQFFTHINTSLKARTQRLKEQRQHRRPKWYLFWRRSPAVRPTSSN